MNDANESLVRLPAVMVGRKRLRILVAVAVTLAFCPDARSGVAEARPLNLAASRGAERVRLLHKAVADLNWADADGGKTLMSAAASGDEEAVRLLLDAGAEPNAEDHEGRTPYWYAPNCNNEGAAELLAPLAADHRSSESTLGQSFH